MLWSLENGYCGLENLSGIPGSIGAAPIQNIGAYWSEVSDFIDEVICFDMDSNSLVSFTNNDCKFSYRQSIFQEKASLIVVKVKFKLTKDLLILETKNIDPISEDNNLVDEHIKLLNMSLIIVNDNFQIFRLGQAIVL